MSAPAPGTPLAELETPRLLVDVEILERNLADMAAFARESGVRLRPHWKTHKCPEIAGRQLALGAGGGTVAKTGEAEVFAAAGCEDLLVATPVVDPDKIARLLRLEERVRVTALVESAEGVRRWAAGAAAVGRPARVLLEIDVGHRRTGVPPGEEALPLAREIAAEPRLELGGVLTHAGHAYGAASRDEIEAIGRQEGERLVATARVLEAVGIPCPVVSVGSTPTVGISGRVPGVTEIRPGNYVFHDRIQVGLGVVSPSRCALTVLATVTARPVPERVVLDTGAKTLTSDCGVGGGAVPGFGCVADRPEHILARLSEEHGLLEVTPDAPYRIGDRVRILPNHACVTTNQHDELVAVRGDVVEAAWPIAARGRIR